ncbi:MAG TPA: NUDIX domain-containing protein [Patescibacteria group bacterium]|nr:NUDIX domain-containing protein [Patescibacteria group bacterium]
MENNKTLTTVRALILNESNKIILLKRSPSRLYNKNKWELPGGKIIKRLTLNDAIEQKVYEEAKIVIRVTSDNYFCQSRIVTEKGKYSDFVYLEITTSADFISGTVKINQKEHSDFQWINIFQAQELDLSHESNKAISNYIFNKYIEPKKQKKLEIVGRALIKHKNKYLVLKRSVKSLFPGTWELPGGKLDSFELLNESLKREVFEETGLLIDIKKPALQISSRISTEITYEGITFIIVINEASIRSGKIRLSKEHDDYKWVTQREILKLNLTPSIKLPLNEIFLK